MSTIMLFTTGGTIASRDRRGGTLRSPQLSGRELLQFLPSSLPDAHDIEVIELGLLPSTAITPALAFDWALEVQQHLQRDDVVGAVLTIGTNAIEECSYLFDLILNVPKPVVFTGAIRMPGQLSSDASRNLVSSLCVVRDRRFANFGVVVVMNDEIHAARDVVKTHSYGVHAFSSPSVGILGRVIERPPHEDHQIVIERNLVSRTHIPASSLETKVGYVKTVLGSDGLLIDALLAARARGIVIEALGEGSTASGMASSIEAAIHRGVVVVIASRALGGGTAPIYTEVGESRWLLDHGALFAGTLSGPKARIKLMLALGVEDASGTRKFFAQDG